MEATAYLQQARLVLQPGTFSVVKARSLSGDYFAAIVDGKEITLVQREDLVDPANVLDVEPGWKIITFDVVLPFELTGFLAVVAGRLANAGIAVFALSAFSTDHILVKEEKLGMALEALKTEKFKM